MDKYVVSFDKSNEDVPVLVVSRENYFSIGGPSIDIVKVITGNEATEIWNDLTKKGKK